MVAVSEQFLADVRALVEYNLYDERTDYEEMVRLGEIEAGAGTHIYEAILRMDNVLTRVGVHA